MKSSSTDVLHNRTILIYCYAFDSKSRVFAHQKDIILRLAELFSTIIVMAPQIEVIEQINPENENLKPNSLNLIPIHFKKGRPIYNSLLIIFKTMKLIREFDIDHVFYFMTDRYAALLSPIFRVMRKSQSLWYAHAHRSFGLNFSKMFVDRILSSTYGSLRVHSKNTELLGQMVNHEHFEPPTRPREDISKFLIVGRLDPSKNVPLLLKTFNSWRLDHPWTKLLIVGSPSSPESGLIIRKELTKYENMVSSGAVNLLPFVQRHDLADIYRAHDIFLHAFDGSLDKTLIEATLTCLPVVTLNREYIAEFGSWGEDPSSLFGEIDSIYRMPKSALKAELVRRRKIAIERHSEEQWVKKMARILLT